MGYSQHKPRTAVVLAVMLLMLPLTAEASTARDLYAFYGEEFESDAPVEILKVIDDYRAAQRFVRQYRYVAVTYDNTSKEDTSTLRERLANLAVQLRNGFYLSVSELSSLESLYRDTLKEYNEAVSKNNSYTIESPLTIDYDVPTAEEYNEAMRIHAEYAAKENIGDMSSIKVFSQASLIDDFGDDFITYMVTPRTPTLALFNGEISEVGEDFVTVDCYSGIVVEYSGLEPSVGEGVTVYQGLVLGYSSNRVTIRLKLRDSYVDVYKLLEGGYNEND